MTKRPVTFYNQPCQMPSTCSIRSLSWSYAEQLTRNQIFKTSFSRSNPVPRGQATVIRCAVRQGPKPSNNDSIQSDKLPTYIQSLTKIRSARPS